MGDRHHFEFDLDRGIRRQVIETLEASPLLELVEGIAPSASGIYALYFRGRLVYIGKASSSVTKSKRTLRVRLSEHRRKITTPPEHHTCRDAVQVPYLRQRLVGVRGRVGLDDALCASME